MAQSATRAPSLTPLQQARSAQALVADLDQAKHDNLLRSLELIIEEAQLMLKSGWTFEEVERCSALLDGAATLSREARNVTAERGDFK